MNAPQFDCGFSMQLEDLRSNVFDDELSFRLAPELCEEWDSLAITERNSVTVIVKNVDLQFGDGVVVRDRSMSEDALA